MAASFPLIIDECLPLWNLDNRIIEKLPVVQHNTLVKIIYYTKKNMCFLKKNISEVDNNRDQPISSLLLDQKTNYYHHYFV